MNSPFKEENRTSSKESRDYGNWIRSEYRHIKNKHMRAAIAAKDIAGDHWWIYEWCKIPVYNHNTETNLKKNLKR